MAKIIVKAEPTPVWATIYHYFHQTLNSIPARSAFYL